MCFGMVVMQCIERYMAGIVTSNIVYCSATEICGLECVHATIACVFGVLFCQANLPDNLIVLLFVCGFMNINEVMSSKI